MHNYLSFGECGGDGDARDYCVLLQPHLNNYLHLMGGSCYKSDLNFLSFHQFQSLLTSSGVFLLFCCWPHCVVCMMICCCFASAWMSFEECSIDSPTHHFEWQMKTLLWNPEMWNVVCDDACYHHMKLGQSLCHLPNDLQCLCHWFLLMLKHR